MLHPQIKIEILCSLFRLLPKIPFSFSYIIYQEEVLLVTEWWWPCKEMYPLNFFILNSTSDLQIAWELDTCISSVFHIRNFYFACCNTSYVENKYYLIIQICIVKALLLYVLFLKWVVQGLMQNMMVISNLERILFSFCIIYYYLQIFTTPLVIFITCVFKNCFILTKCSYW